MAYPNLTNEEIQKLTDAIGKSDIKKEKLKVLGKTLPSLVIVAGGVAVSIIFPNPITIAVLGGAATLIAGNNGILNKTKKIKEKKKSKEEVKNLNTEQNNPKFATYMQGIINQQKGAEPSAPLYPNLN